MTTVDVRLRRDTRSLTRRRLLGAAAGGRRGRRPRPAWSARACRPSWRSPPTRLHRRHAGRAVAARRLRRAVGDRAARRPRLLQGPARRSRVPKSQVIAGDAMFGLHPALAPLLPLWQGGKLAAVHAVGQPNPTRSHFAAMEEMERAAAGTSVRTGWLDRMLGLDRRHRPVAGVVDRQRDARPAVRRPVARRLDGARSTGSRWPARAPKRADGRGAARDVRRRAGRAGRARRWPPTRALTATGAARRGRTRRRTARSTRRPRWAPRCATSPG